MRDVAGNKYELGAIVRMYHFTGARKRKHFMYKQVTEIDIDKRRVGFAHLPIKETVKTSFTCSFEEIAKDTVIVQNYYEDGRNLKKSKFLRD